jgi:hypothetical protein
VIDLYTFQRELSLDSELGGGSRDDFWPPMLLPIHDLGCCQYLGLNCKSKKAPVAEINPDRKPAVRRIAPSLPEWFGRWFEKYDRLQASGRLPEKPSFLQRRFSID